ncbi:MAG: NAD(P)/FAD-dependent oxidoreductase [Chitinophagaceae bacterium]|nr:NAD(P)/FAD-dependent oxidoreductase [Chitinophagaceae bacterium]
MSIENSRYDLAIIGGGLAGLALSIQAAKAGYKTVLFEKEQYPFHRVCGEYISLESWDFLERLGLPLSQMNLPIIKTLQVTAPNGKLFQTKLPLGGFGISRYTLDNELAKIAKAVGVTVLENTKVNDVQYNNGVFKISEVGSSPLGGGWEGAIVCGSFGKRSNLDVKWNRSFIQQKPNKLNNYIGVKYHIKTQHPPDVIALHNFENGYCGISQIEDGKYCLCYLTTAENLKRSNNSIEQLQQTILYKNPHLKKIFTHAEFLYEAPVTISQISFDNKAQLENHVLMLGDAAGMIKPLCGNGMSMALHSSKLAFECVDAFLQNNSGRAAMEQRYVQLWNQQFAHRLRTGRMIQRFFGKSSITNLFIQSFRTFPFLASPLIQQTHGKPF